MRTLSATMREALSKPALDAIWLARLHWASGVQRLATRAVVVGADAYVAGLAGSPEIELSQAGTDDLLSLGEERAAMSVIRRGSAELEPGGFGDRLRAEEIVGCAVEFAFVALPAGSTPLANDDPIWLFAGTIEKADVEPLRARIEARGWSASPRAAIPGPLAPVMLQAHGLDPTRRIVPPIVFGRVREAALAPWRGARRTRLASSVDADDKVLSVESLDGWPTSGRAQIADEVLAYGAVDRILRTLGRADTPLIRPEARAHGRGAAALWLPPGGPDWLVAGHPCKAVRDLRAGDLAIPDVEATLEEVAELGLDTGIPGARTLTLLRLERFPSSTQYSATAIERRIPPSEADMRLSAESTARNGPAAIDEDGATSARLDSARNTLGLEIHWSVGRAAGPGATAGDRRYGRLESVFVEMTLGASRVWLPGSRILARLRRGANTAAWVIGRPSDSQFQALVPSPLAPAAVPAIEDSRGLFRAEPVRAAVNFHNAAAGDGGGAWESPEAALDGRADTWARFSPSGDDARPLTFSTRWLPVSGAGVTARAAWIHVVARGLNESNATIGARLRPASGSAFAWTFDVGGAFEHHALEMTGVEGANIESLLGELAALDVFMRDGDGLDVASVWAEIEYTVALEGQTRALNYAVASDAADDYIVAGAPVPPRAYRIDVTAWAAQWGGWGAFGDAAESMPVLECVFEGPNDPAVIAVYEVALRAIFCPATSSRLETDLTATIEGRMDGTGALERTPTAILRDMLTAADLGGDGAAEFEEAEWGAAQAVFEASGWAMARRIAQAHHPAHLAAEVAREAGLVLAREGRTWRIRVARNTLRREEVVATLDDNCVVDASILGRPRLGSVANDVVVSTGDRILARATNSASMSRGWGRRRLDATAFWLDVGEKGREAAARWAERLLARRGDRLETVGVRLGLGAAALERGDVVSVSSMALGFSGRLGEIARLLWSGDGDTIAATLRLAAASGACWESPGGEARLERDDGGAALLWIVGGVLVARVTSDGNLRLRGEIVERAFAPGEAATALSWDAAGDRVCLAGGNEPNLQLLATLDGNGNLALAGEAIERAALGDAPGPVCYGLSNGELFLSPDHEQVAARLDAAQGDLRVRGEIQESAANP